MRRWPKHENRQSLREEHVFSSEELELLLQRTNEELEYASSDILRIWFPQAAKTRRTDRWQF